MWDVLTLSVGGELRSYDWLKAVMSQTNECWDFLYLKTVFKAYVGTMG